MASSEVHRKLTAILCTDVVGYSRLMGDDPEGTLKTLTEYREVFSDKIQEYKGRVVNAPGDSLLAEFVSVLDAVSCAVDIQRELAERNQELPDNRRMDFRIGINLGDVLVKDNDLYGDGVNVAARLESLAEPGGICISGSVHEQVKARLPLHYEFMGEQRVKNIAEPVKTYRVLSKPGAAAHRVVKARRAVEVTWKKAVVAVVVVLLLVGGGFFGWNYYQQRTTRLALAAFEKEAAFPLPEKPSIAVLAFKNLSGDPEQDYFGDGLSENIITRLARLSDMFVIARNSSFAYKGKSVDVRQIGQELGVRYVLEGSVQKAGERVRITAQLIDAATGRHLWADSYDRELKGLLAVQDEITRKVVTELEVKLTKGEAALYSFQETSDVQAFDHFLRAENLWRRFDKDTNSRIREIILSAIELDPKYARAFAKLGKTHYWDARYGWAKNPDQSRRQAEELAKQAIALDDTVADAHILLGLIYLERGLHDQAIAAGKRALELEANNSGAVYSLAFWLTNAGKPEEGLVQIKKAMRLSPYYPVFYLITLGAAYRGMEQYEEAITAFKALHERSPNDNFRIIAAWNLAILYNIEGREEEARAEVNKILKIDPKYSLKNLRGLLLYKDKEYLEFLLDHARKAGLPE